VKKRVEELLTSLQWRPIFFFASNPGRRKSFIQVHTLLSHQYNHHHDQYKHILNLDFPLETDPRRPRSAGTHERQRLDCAGAEPHGKPQVGREVTLQHQGSGSLRYHTYTQTTDLMVGVEDLAASAIATPAFVTLMHSVFE